MTITFTTRRAVRIGAKWGGGATVKGYDRTTATERGVEIAHREGARGAWRGRSGAKIENAATIKRLNDAWKGKR